MHLVDAASNKDDLDTVWTAIMDTAGETFEALLGSGYGTTFKVSLNGHLQYYPISVTSDPVEIDAMTKIFGNGSPGVQTPPATNTQTVSQVTVDPQYLRMVAPDDAGKKKTSAGIQKLPVFLITAVLDTSMQGEERKIKSLAKSKNTNAFLEMTSGTTIDWMADQCKTILDSCARSNDKSA